MQSQIKIDRLLTPCDCSKQPKPYSERHAQQFFLECAPCAKRTGKYATLGEAVQAWEQASTNPIPARAA